ncbi:Uncharacterized protein FWK35_00010573 [Aphis craccivora]|uniref:Uncharacterized protein n=1 Tax=Aphis craccivora TaxID=307492 RepID=A0A6G0ZPR9_APHCR|nr:Uncharacterized protein FWK35_00010573 [Aphis craccivora]
MRIMLSGRAWEAIYCMYSQLHNETIKMSCGKFATSNCQFLTKTKNSEQSDECIDFTSYVFFFVSIYTRTFRNNASIFNFSTFSGSKVNLVGALGRSYFVISNSFQKHRLNFQKVPYDSNFYEICRKRENLQRNDNDLSSNDFKYFISRRYLKNLPIFIDNRNFQFFLKIFGPIKILENLRVENSIRDFP